MTVPTTADLNAEVDRQFHDQHPEAPTQLDNNDPGQADLVTAWLSIRDRVVNDWTDKVFYEYFPAAGKLDPNNPADQQLIDYWLDIRNQIRDGATPRYDWSGSGPAQDVRGSTRTATQLQSVTPDYGGFLLTFDGATDPDAVGRWLWPNGVPAGAQLTAQSATTFRLTGLSTDALQAMNSDAAGMIAQAGVITAESSGGATPAPDPVLQPSDVKVIDEDAKRELENKIKDWLEGTHQIASVTEVTAYLTQAGAHLAEGTAAISAAEGAAVAAEAAAGILAPLGGVALIVWTGFEVIDAFKGERRGEDLQGFVYGVMWQAMDEPDHLPKFAPGITYSAEELQEAFVSGVQRGRQHAGDPKVRNRILLVVGVMAERTGFGEMWAAQQVLSEIWRDNREHTPGDTPQDLLMWPQPPDRTVLGN
jgi:hypothetical protein